MRLKRVTLRNFRCFDKLDLELHPRLTVLVAENGGGKTAILDGISFGLVPVLNHLSSANQRLSVPKKKDTDLRLVPRAGRTGKTSWVTSDSAQVEIETLSGIKWDRVQLAKKGKQPDNRTGQAELAAYTSRIFDSMQGEGQELLPVFAYYGARRGWIEVPGRLRDTKVNYEYPASALVGALDSLADFKEMLKWFDLAESAEWRANKGGKPDEFEESPALAAVRGAISAILTGEYHNPQFTNKHQFVVESKTTPGMLLRVEQISQGYQSMLALAMDFARRLALANDHLDYDNIMSIIVANMDYVHPKAVDNSDVWASPPLFAPAIMLVDEIDLHLHPTWQQRVLDDLMRAFPCTQFIVTTHSPQVLTTLRKENIRVLSCDDGQWTANEPSFSPLAHESGDALAMIMGTHPRPDLGGIMSDLYAYEQLARAGQAGSEEAQQLKDRLDAAGFEFSAADQALFNYLAAKASKDKAGKP